MFQTSTDLQEQPFQKSSKSTFQFSSKLESFWKAVWFWKIFGMAGLVESCVWNILAHPWKIMNEKGKTSDVQARLGSARPRKPAAWPKAEPSRTFLAETPQSC